jgi:phenylacetate-CoA ligase
MGISAFDILSISDLKKLPVLNKETIKTEGVEFFTSQSIKHNQRINMSSSGSTGEPLFYTRSKEAQSIGAYASNLRGWQWMGYNLGDRYMKLSQNPRKSVLKRIQDGISNNLYLSTNPLVPENFDYILSQIETFKPKIIRCYPDPLLLIARHKKKYRHKFNFTPLALTTTGNTLFLETRKEIEDAFGTKIFDAYSCEGNSTVFECPSHTCYHTAEEYGISEVIDENGNEINKGVGRLISTDLWNLSHPFVRYDTQDYVEVDDTPCICGRKLFKIIRILGRDNDVLETPSGRKFIVHNFTGFFQTDRKELNRSIDQFQVIKRVNELVIKLVVNGNYRPEMELFITKFWENEMQINVRVEVVKTIPLGINGKRKFIITET